MSPRRSALAGLLHALQAEPHRDCDPDGDGPVLHEGRPEDPLSNGILGRVIEIWNRLDDTRVPDAAVLVHERLNQHGSVDASAACLGRVFGGYLRDRFRQFLDMDVLAESREVRIVGMQSG